MPIYIDEMQAFARLRERFIHRMTVDMGRDARRVGFNQAIFFPADDPDFPGRAVFTDTSLDMVLAAFDKAIKDVTR